MTRTRNADPADDADLALRKRTAMGTLSAGSSADSELLPCEMPILVAREIPAFWTYCLRVCLG
jgi:hypothetical protein